MVIGLTQELWLEGHVTNRRKKERKEMRDPLPKKEERAPLDVWGVVVRLQHGQHFVDLRHMRHAPERHGCRKRGCTQNRPPMQRNGTHRYRASGCLPTSPLRISPGQSPPATLMLPLGHQHRGLFGVVKPPRPVTNLFAKRLCDLRCLSDVGSCPRFAHGEPGV